MHDRRALWLAPRLGGTPEKQILALGGAVLAAGLLQLLFQLPSLKGINLLTQPRWAGSIRACARC